MVLATETHVLYLLQVAGEADWEHRDVPVGRHRLVYEASVDDLFVLAERNAANVTGPEILWQCLQLNRTLVELLQELFIELLLLLGLHDRAGRDLHR